MGIKEAFERVRENMKEIEIRDPYARGYWDGLDRTLAIIAEECPEALEKDTGKLVFKLKLSDVVKLEDIYDIILDKLPDIIKQQDLRATKIYPNQGEEQLKKACEKIKVRAAKIAAEAQSNEDLIQSNLLYARWEELHLIEDMLNAMIDDLKEEQDVGTDET